MRFYFIYLIFNDLKAGTCIAIELLSIRYQSILSTAIRGFYVR
ncbi:Hypothetical protein ETEE_1298 [Edwardsiella anguillarum ET080813]|uniref:Uncharacterized protein n=1 Tax=Edwardsiella anguillarum ET080813 TaxID=667120 RepID=A0A076LLZ0_9GAMM|nr:Hypothetical protein ETEE_1298 [Edwardsiella anguillarum ET080813]